MFFCSQLKTRYEYIFLGGGICGVLGINAVFLSLYRNIVSFNKYSNIFILKRFFNIHFHKIKSHSTQLWDGIFHSFSSVSGQHYPLLCNVYCVVVLFHVIIYNLDPAAGEEIAKIVNCHFKASLHVSLLKYNRSPKKRKWAKMRDLLIF